MQIQNSLDWFKSRLWQGTGRGVKRINREYSTRDKRQQNREVLNKGRVAKTGSGILEGEDINDWARLKHVTLRIQELWNSASMINTEKSHLFASLWNCKAGMRPNLLIVSGKHVKVKRQVTFQWAIIRLTSDNLDSNHVLKEINCHAGSL